MKNTSFLKKMKIISIFLCIFTVLSFLQSNVSSIAAEESGDISDTVIEEVISEEQNTDIEMEPFEEQEEATEIESFEVEESSLSNEENNVLDIAPRAPAYVKDTSNINVFDKNNKATWTKTDYANAWDLRSSTYEVFVSGGITADKTKGSYGGEKVTFRNFPLNISSTAGRKTINTNFGILIRNVRYGDQLVDLKVSVLNIVMGAVTSSDAAAYGNLIYLNMSIDTTQGIPSILVQSSQLPLQSERIDIAFFKAGTNTPIEVKTPIGFGDYEGYWDKNLLENDYGNPNINTFETAVIYNGTDTNKFSRYNFFGKWGEVISSVDSLTGRPISIEMFKYINNGEVWLNKNLRYTDTASVWNAFNINDWSPKEAQSTVDFKGTKFETGRVISTVNTLGIAGVSESNKETLVHGTYFGFPYALPSEITPPRKYVSDSDEKLAEKNMLSSAAETFTYTFDAEFPVQSYEEYALKGWQISDTLPEGISLNGGISAIKVENRFDNTNLTSKFTSTINGQNLIVKANTDTLKDMNMYGQHSSLRITVPVRITDESKVVRDGNGNVAISNRIWLVGTYFNDEKVSLSSNYVLTTTAQEMAEPRKYVSDSDEKLTQKNMLDNVDEAYTYTFDVEFPVQSHQEHALTDWRITDTLPSGISLNEGVGDIKVVNRENDTDLTNKFSSEINGQNLTVKANADTLKDMKMYGEHAKLRVTVPVKITDTSKVTLDSKGNINIVNRIWLSWTTFNGEKLPLASNYVNTTTPPEMEAPKKYVSDSDEELKLKNMLDNVDEAYTYTFDVEFPVQSHQEHALTDWRITDTLPSGISLNEGVGDIKVVNRENNTDLTNKFSSDINGQNLTVKANADTLKDMKMYGEHAKLRVTVPVKITDASEVTLDSKGNINIVNRIWLSWTTFNGEKLPLASNYVNTTTPPEMEAPRKYVSDSDEELKLKNILNDVDETYTYTFDAEFPVLSHEEHALTDWRITDTLPNGISLNQGVGDIKVVNRENNTDLTTKFSSDINGQNLTVKANPDTLKDMKMYGEHAKLRITVPVKITDASKVTLDNNGNVNIVNRIWLSWTMFNDEKLPLASNYVSTTVDTTQADCRIELIKVDDDDENLRLAGAEFELRDSENNIVQSGLVTDDNGVLRIELPSGDYQLIETKAPEGYELDPTPIEFTVEANTNVSINKENFLEWFDLKDNAVYDSSTGIATLTEDMENRKGSIILKKSISTDERSEFSLKGKVNLGVRNQELGVAGADGLAFGFTSNGSTQLGENMGNAFGVGGVKNSFGFKLDTWWNHEEDRTTRSAKDPLKFAASGNAAASGVWNHSFGSFIYTDDSSMHMLHSYEGADASPEKIDGPKDGFRDIEFLYSGESRTMTVKYEGKTWTKEISEWLKDDVLDFGVFASTGGHRNIHQFQIEEIQYTQAIKLVKTNKKSTLGRFDLLKIDAESKEPLSDAEFTLARSKKDAEEGNFLGENGLSYQGDNQSFQEARDLAEADGTKLILVKTNEAGLAAVDGLELNSITMEREYWLVEIKAPNGYEILKEPRSVLVNLDPEGAKTIEITIENQKNTFLPFTGGTNLMILITAIGSTLGILGLGVYLLFSRGKNVNRNQVL